jgi:AmiR/NasT family two-component response regulator
MLTAYGFDDYKERAANIGACGYIHKPVTSATLIPQLEAAYSAFRRKPAG